VVGGDFRSGLWPSGFVAVLTQGFALGWDVAASLALRAVAKMSATADSLREWKLEKQVQVRIRGLSTGHDMKQSCFGRDDGVVMGEGQGTAEARLLGERRSGRLLAFLGLLPEKSFVTAVFDEDAAIHDYVDAGLLGAGGGFEVDDA
jgi:hypothetical protein